MNELERIDEDERLEGGLYIEPVDYEEVKRRAVTAIVLMGAIVEALEAAGRLPTFTRAMRMVVPSADLYSVRSGGAGAG